MCKQFLSVLLKGCPVLTLNWFRVEEAKALEHLDST